MQNLQNFAEFAEICRICRILQNLQNFAEFPKKDLKTYISKLNINIKKKHIIIIYKLPKFNLSDLYIYPVKTRSLNI